MPGGGPRPCAASSSRRPPRSRHFADPVSWQARLLFVGGKRDSSINDSEDAGGATPRASRCLASRTEEDLTRLLLAVSMGEPLCSRNGARTLVSSIRSSPARTLERRIPDASFGLRIASQSLNLPDSTGLQVG